MTAKLLVAACSLNLVHAGEPGDEDHDRFSIMLGGSMTGAGDVSFPGLGVGEVETSRYRFEAGYAVPFGDSLMLEIGGEYGLLQTDYSGRQTIIPEDLSKIALNLRAMWKISDHWSASASISPGFYGDDEVDLSDAFNAPLMVIGHWQKSDSLTLSLGLRVDTFSDSSVMPVAGIGWKINPDWELNLGMPRTELRYQWSKDLSLYMGVSMEGESYAVDSPTIVTPSGRPMRETYLSESEFRGLLGFDYSFSSGLKLSVEGGYAFDRTFDYHEQGYELEVDPGAFGALSVSFSF